MKIAKASALASCLLAGSLLLCSCEGRKMSNMEPTGDTVEVALGADADTASQAADAPNDSAI